MSKKLYTLILLAALYCGNAFAQNCTSNATSYDLVTSTTVILGPTANPSYTQAFICNLGVLIDSAMCCTRFVLVDDGGHLVVGPLSYGTAYVLNGGTFDGQGASNNWMVIAEPNSLILGHTGPLQSCSAIAYTPGCTTGLAETESVKPSVTLDCQTLNFGFSTEMNDARIELLDVNGKVVKSEMMNQSSTLTMDVSGLASGVYLYRVMQGAELISSDKLVISE